MISSTVPVIEIGGTHVTAALVDTSSWAVVPATTVRRDLDASAPAGVLVHAIVDSAETLRRSDRTRWGVAIPGPFDYVRGVGDFTSVGKLDSLRGVDLGAILRRELTGSTGQIAFVNDAEAFAVGEWVAGAAIGHRRVIGITLGTGIGSTFLVDGVSQHAGPGVPPEGRLDLLTIGGRPLEGTVSRRAIRARYASVTGDPVASLDVREIAQRARAGEQEASEVLADTARALGAILAPRALAFGATIIVVGGSIALAWDVLEDPLRAGMSAGVPDEISSGLERSDHLHDAALIGAARQAVRPGISAPR